MNNSKVIVPDQVTIDTSSVAVNEGSLTVNYIFIKPSTIDIDERHPESGLLINRVDF